MSMNDVTDLEGKGGLMVSVTTLLTSMTSFMCDPLLFGLYKDIQKSRLKLKKIIEKLHFLGKKF